MYKLYFSILLILFSNGVASAQLLDKVGFIRFGLSGFASPLSPAEERYNAINLTLESVRTLYANPSFSHLHNMEDTAHSHKSALIYTGMSGADGKGDFIPYEGDGSNDCRIGAYGEYTMPHGGTLSGCIQYAKGKHRNIGWSAMRLPELYYPYISTDSCGGDFKFDGYYAEGNYGFALSQCTLGVKGSFYGEQAYRITDPRALNNTTWLRFDIGAARQLNGHLLMIDAGYGRNKQHMQLRYWRPGQQDRFFVCYGFGLYDTRQSAVSFGKSRMYYVDEYRARIQYQSPRNRRLLLHASLDYAYDRMETEESDIYNLYESGTHRFSPLLHLTYSSSSDWACELISSADISLRKGYENIIEEYLIDKENNIYDFRTIDTRQNYSRNISQITSALRFTHRLGMVKLSMQAGVIVNGYEEKYNAGNHRIKVQTLTPSVEAGMQWEGRKEEIDISLGYARQGVGTHHYEVNMQNSQIAHLDFQQAFSPYAYRCAKLDKIHAEITWRHQLRRTTVGVNVKLSQVSGRRLDDVKYTDAIGFTSTASMISPLPDTHEERWGSVTVFMQF